MSLFHFIKQNHAVGLSPHGLGQLSALAVAQESRRRTNQLRDGVAFHIFGHVHPYEGRFAAAEVNGERFREFGLANARRAGKEEASNRSLGMAHACPRPSHCPRDGSHGFILANYSLMQLLF